MNPFVFIMLLSLMVVIVHHSITYRKVAKKCKPIPSKWYMKYFLLSILLFCFYTFLIGLGISVFTSSKLAIPGQALPFKIKFDTENAAWGGWYEINEPQYMLTKINGDTITGKVWKADIKIRSFSDAGNIHHKEKDTKKFTSRGFIHVPSDPFYIDKQIEGAILFEMDYTTPNYINNTYSEESENILVPFKLKVKAPSFVNRLIFEVHAYSILGYVILALIAALLYIILLSAFRINIITS